LLQNELSSDVARFTTQNLNRLPKDLQKEEGSFYFLKQNLFMLRVVPIQGKLVLQQVTSLTCMA